MSLSMYQATVPVYVRMLQNLTAILDKSAAHAEAKKFDPAILINARLAPDMFALCRQVQIVTDTAKGSVARLAGIEIPKYEDTETSFDELKARISKTIAFIESVPASQIDGSEGREIVLKVRGNDMHFAGQPYLLNFALPNFYFHLVTAYDILRHHGVELGKPDYLGAY
ncbi:DUF1993 family protein [Chitinimonas sp.]|uniref:DUF1993 domain-containing protein n=1 Tax=Chitinimonas sp. TaxID=1934313 RepID=UPI0035AE09D0